MRAPSLRMTVAATAVIVTAAIVRFAGAQFISPSSQPPTGGPTVIYSIAPASAPQTANINVSGAVKAAGCVGGTYAGVSAVVADTSLANGYKSADALCAATVTGSHVCRVEEVMESIRCGVTLPNGVNGWVNGGPPGFTANANDCAGWTTNSGAAYGRFWQFSSASGGTGTMTPCNENGLPYACCK